MIFISKYNNIKSIPINSLTKEELEIAIKEWAEGDSAMERLLRLCYQKGIETSGCHAGSRPYLDFYLNEEEKNVIKLLNTTEKIKESTVFVSTSGGNPFSGPDWYKVSITIGFKTKYKDEADTYFNNLSYALLNEDRELLKDSLYTQIIDLTKYFTGKESGILFRFSHLENDEYKFSAQISSSNKKFDYFNNLFTKAGLVFDMQTSQDIPKKWFIKDSDLDRLIKKVKRIIKYIIENYSLKKPSSEEECDNFYDLALYKRRKFKELKDGDKLFNEWLEIKRKERDEEFKKRSSH